ncbi:RNA-dependent RNA polymerase [Robigovirus elaeis]|uniref:RNA-dependent RNA polymerase n=1 Tax=Robigovirus elaeis TaxID=185218 RepID=Q8UZK2_9VIRU|nr:RNA-dependent RNA polymerase [African oil palm ringspot virus]AAL68924.2 RNA-dependent RNA polymerase [African oil palm ringspot virus]
MALHYISAPEQVVSLFSSEAQSRISAMALQNFSSFEEEAHAAFNYHLEAYPKSRLCKKGVYLSPYSFVSHSHPVCKTLESYIINKKIVNYIDDKYIFVGIKDSKLAALRVNKKLRMAEVINRYVSAHDIQRYGADAYFNCAKMAWRGRKVGLPLVDLVPRVLTSGKRRIFLYDELHYWTTNDLIDFIDITNPEVIVATFVYPKEILVGCKESLNPWAYKFEIFGSTIKFAPDGVWSESYEQPVEAGDILRLNKLVTKHGIYSIQVRDSIFCHSVVIISKGDLVTEKRRIFSDFDAIRIGELRPYRGRVDEILPVRHDIVLSIFKYLRTLKKPDLQSAMAKHRQICDEPTGFEVRFIEDFSAFLLANNCTHDLIERGFGALLKGAVFNLMPDYMKPFFSSLKEMSLSRFIEQVKPFEFYLDCETGRRSFDIPGWCYSVIESSIESTKNILDEKILEVACKIPSPKATSSNPYDFSAYDCVLNIWQDAKPSLSIARAMLERLMAGAVNVCSLSAASNLFGDGETEFKRKLKGNLLGFYLSNRKALQPLLIQVLAQIRREAKMIKPLRLLKQESYSDELSRSSPALKKAKCGVQYFKELFQLCTIEILSSVNPAEVSAEGEGLRGTSKPERGAVSVEPTCLASPAGNVNETEEIRADTGELPSDVSCSTPLHQEPTTNEPNPDKSSNVSDSSLSANNPHSKMGDEWEGKPKPDCHSEDSKERVTEFLLNCSILRTRDCSSIPKVAIFPVPADGDCFWHAAGSVLGVDAGKIKERLRELAADIEDSDIKRKVLFQLSEREWAADESIAFFCDTFNVQTTAFVCDKDPLVFTSVVTFCPMSGDSDSFQNLMVKFNSVTQHFDLALPKNGCVIRAIAEFLNQKPAKVLSVISKECSKELVEDIMSGLGVQPVHLKELFSFFDIAAEVRENGNSRLINAKGSRSATFQISDDHMTFLCSGRSSACGSLSLQPRIVSMGPEADYESFTKEGSGLIQYEPSFERASRLAKSLLQGSTGVFSSKLVWKRYDWLQDKSKLQFGKRGISFCVGTFGSGKSSSAIRYLKDHLGYKNTVVTPRRFLCNQIKEQLGFKEGKIRRGVQTNVLTFETALAKIAQLKNSRFFIDESQLFPPGYLDLLCLILPRESTIFLMGDPAQSSYDSEADRHIFSDVSNDLDVLLDKSNYQYLVYSHRFKNPVFNKRLPCEFHEGSFNLVSEGWTFYSSWEEIKLAISKKNFSCDAFLVSAFAEKKLVQFMMGKQTKVYTFGESTGMNLKHACVLLTYDSQQADEKRWLVALSRSSEGISFLNLSGRTMQQFADDMSPSVFTKFVSSTAKLEDLRCLLPGKPSFVKKFQRIGSDEVDREERLKGDPWLKTKIFLGQRAEVPVEPQESEEPPPVLMKTHCPLGSLGLLQASHDGHLKAKERREKRVDFDLVTDQFTEEYSKGFSHAPAPERFEAIYPRHKAGDTATFVMAARKRLFFSRPNVEAAKLRAALPYGDMMKDIFLSHVPIKHNWDQRLFEESKADFERKKLEKSAATIENHSGRSNPDWSIREALIFMKSQICTKFDNRYRDAKAGQTLACFHHNVLCRFAPYIRYIEKKLFQALPNQFYIHSGKNFDDLNDWILNADFSRVCTESDYEAFDSSQDSNILAFEVSIMKFLHIPVDLISDYIYLKQNTVSKLGAFATMRFTGEAATFLFNTMANMVFTFMRYSISKFDKIAFAGDDMCANRNLPVTNAFEEILSRMKLKAKVLRVRNPTFCGWCLTKFGIYKRPQLVAERLIIAIERGNLADCIDNYAIEVSYAYNLGERLVSIMSEKEVESHYFCVRTIIKNSKLCKSNISQLFNEGRSVSPGKLF